MRLIHCVRYYWHLARLIDRSFRVWGITWPGTFVEWEIAVRRTPLYREADLLRQERHHLFGGTL